MINKTVDKPIPIQIVEFLSMLVLYFKAYVVIIKIVLIFNACKRQIKIYALNAGISLVLILCIYIYAQ
jgi:hypothetical protein